MAGSGGAAVALSALQPGWRAGRPESGVPVPAGSGAPHPDQVSQGPDLLKTQPQPNQVLLPRAGTASPLLTPAGHPAKPCGEANNFVRCCQVHPRAETREHLKIRTQIFNDHISPERMSSFVLCDHSQRTGKFEENGENNGKFPGLVPSKFVVPGTSL